MWEASKTGMPKKHGDLAHWKVQKKRFKLENNLIFRISAFRCSLDMAKLDTMNFLPNRPFP